MLRFNTRGTRSPRGTSGGQFDGGVDERFDVDAAMAFVAERGLPHPWLVGWSFGTELALMYGRELAVDGVILLSPPLHRATPEHSWPRGRATTGPMVALIPEHDDYLRPAAAAERFAPLPQIELVNVEGGKHLWVGENQTRRVLDEIVRAGQPGGAAAADRMVGPGRGGADARRLSCEPRQSSFWRGITTCLMISRMDAANGIAISAPRMPRSDAAGERGDDDDARRARRRRGS